MKPISDKSLSKTDNYKTLYLCYLSLMLQSLLLALQQQLGVQCQAQLHNMSFWFSSSCRFCCYYRRRHSELQMVHSIDTSKIVDLSKKKKTQIMSTHIYYYKGALH